MTDRAATAQPCGEDPNDPVLTASLPLSAWVVIGSYLRKGAYEDMAMIIPELHRQLMAHLAAHGTQAAPSSQPEMPSQTAAERPPATPATPGEPSSTSTKVVH